MTRNNEFSTKKLNGKGLERISTVRTIFDNLLDGVVGQVPPCRELAIVRTKLEEACFFAIKGISNEYLNQDHSEPKS